MPLRYNPRDRRTGRRSLSGWMLPRRRPVPGMLRPPPPPPLRFLSLIGRAIAILLVLAAVLALGATGVAYSAYSQLADSLKVRLDGLEQRQTFQTTRIYDRRGTLLYEVFGGGKRTRVTLDKISPLLINATVAIEDKTFFENRGVDYLGITRSLLSSLSAGEVTGGGSTITQQLIKLAVLTDEERAQGVPRKIKEIALAQELSQRYTKEQILELYLNEIFYGNLAYGIEAASNAYFDVPASRLTLPQAALLAGLPQLPTAYDPFNYLDGNVLAGIPLRDGWLDESYQLPNGTPPPKWRQIAVLRQMVDEGYVSDAEARAAAGENLRFTPQEAPLNAPHFVFYVRRLLEETYGQQFANLGLSVYTTIDLDLQRMVQQTAAERIAELEERNIHNAAVTVMQPNTGQILAMVGSIDYNQSVPSKTPGERGNVLDGQVNVTVRERQPGSALKPFTYLAAMERGMTPETVLWDVPTRFGRTADAYAPTNYNGRWNGPVRMRAALANSLNMPAVKALKFAGVDGMIDLLHRAGISGLQRGAGFYGLSLTLGGGEVTPLDLTTAYNTLASGGRFYPPVAILKVVDGNGQVIDEFKPSRGQQVLNPYHVAVISDMLSDDQARQPIWGLNSKLKLSRSAAVKTGTSNDWRDAWAVGYTPYVTVGVWTGNNNNEATARVESLTGGGVIWHNVMEQMFANPRIMRLLAEPYGGLPPLDFVKPRELIRRAICPLPGPFNTSNTEFFSPDMLDRVRLPTVAPGPGARPAPQPATTASGCEVYRRITAVRLSETPPTDASGETPPDAQVRYCRPLEGEDIPDQVLTEVIVWNLPPPDPDEQVEYRWAGGASRIGDRPAVLGRGQVPTCSYEQIASVFQPGSIRMPDLRRLGENQAKELLASLGATGEIVVDYQDRARIPDVYDQFVPYAVISSIPAAGAWLKPGQTVILGVRAPDAATPAPTEPAVAPGIVVPTPNSSGPSEGQPPAQPGPTPIVIPGTP